MILRRPRLWSITRSAGARTFTRRGFVGPPGSSVIELPISILSPVAETITLRGFVATAGSLTDFRNAKVDTGTATVSLVVTVAGTPTTVFSTTLSSTPQDLTFDADTPVGSVVQFVIASTSGSPTALSGTILGTNTAESNIVELTSTIVNVSARTTTLRGYSSKAGTLTAVKNASCSPDASTTVLKINNVTVSGFPASLNSTPQNVALNVAYPAGAVFEIVTGAVTNPSTLTLTLLGLNS